MVFAFFFFFFYISPIRCTEYTTDMCADLKLPRHPINHNMADDILTQTWFIVMLGSIIAIIIFSFIGMVLIKRIQFIKQTSLTNIHGMYEIYVFACKQIYISVMDFFPSLFSISSVVHGYFLQSVGICSQSSTVICALLHICYAIFLFIAWWY